MSRPGTLHLMVGLPGSGKTTLARRLAAVHLAPDRWHLALWGQDCPDHDRRHAAIEALLEEVAAGILACGPT